jgi:transcriptional regulator with PAS, ATPase and Fis domain
MFRFIPINCAAIPENLLESELFGVEIGAYTDARKKIGRIELAHRGTLFLDEISDMNIVLQSKLLRVLQYKEFERLGGIETLSVDVRILAATNRDIWKEVLEGRFRNDLLYRIQVIKINLPPLRERRDDIPALAQHFLQRYSEKNGTCTKKISKQAMDLLLSHNWPGNVRELENAIEAALVMSNDWILWPDDLPEELRSGAGERSSGYPTIQEMEKEHIVRTLRFCNGNKKRTSQMLGITRQTLDNKLTKYVIRI